MFVSVCIPLLLLPDHVALNVAESLLVKIIFLFSLDFFKFMMSLFVKIIFILYLGGKSGNKKNASRKIRPPHSSCTLY